MKKAGDYFLNFLSATPIVWISCCYLLYLLNFNPRIFAHETLDELFIYWFLPYYVLIGIPLWLILLAYKALRKEYTKRIVVTHVAIFAIGFAILYLMLELNPNGWVNAYFD